MADVSYRLTFPDLHAHLVAVEAWFALPGGGAALDSLDVTMAAWTPGSYLIREYCRHVQDVSAHDQQGRPLGVHKVDKATWRVALAATTSRVCVRYAVYGYDLTVRANHIDDTHVFLNGAPTYLWCPALREATVEVSIEAPEGWNIATQLADRGAAFHARGVDELIDSPIHIGPEPLLAFEAAGKPVHLALWGRPLGTIGLEELVGDITSIIETHARGFDGVPYEDYTFILMLSPNAYGGLEHKSSAALLASPFAFATRDKYEELLELVSHEFFHLWNVKRIRPRPLGPFAYDREAYTRALWMMEGITSYYDRYALVRAQLESTASYVRRLGDDWAKLVDIPGRFQQSIEESSFDAWIKLYRPDENSVNSTVSYYLKGSLVALCLDLHVRARTDGKKSLDDVLGYLWRTYGKNDVGFDERTIVAELGQSVGVDLAEFAARFISGREDPQLDEALATVGLCLVPGHKRTLPAGRTELAWLGVRTKEEPGRVVVASSLRQGPAEKGALFAGDEIVACEGFRVGGDLEGWLDRFEPGQIVHLTVFRRDVLSEVEVTLAARPPDKFEIKPMADAPAVAKQLYEAWLGEPHPPAI